MSIPVPTPPTPAAEFNSHFGTLPGTQDTKAECERWERLCGELLLEREQLRAQLSKEQAAHEKTVLRMMCAEVDPTLTREQVYADVVPGATFAQLVADVQRQAEQSA